MWLQTSVVPVALDALQSSELITTLTESWVKYSYVTFRAKVVFCLLKRPHSLVVIVVRNNS